MKFKKKFKAFVKSLRCDLAKIVRKQKVRRKKMSKLDTEKKRRQPTAKG